MQIPPQNELYYGIGEKSELASTICEILSEEGAVAKWLVHWTTDSGIRVRVVYGELLCVCG